jgi:hypothetical protein
MRVFGFILFTLGVAGIIAAFLFPVSIEPDAATTHAAIMDSIRGITADQLPGAILGAASVSPVVNMDRLALRAMLHLTAAAVMVSGAVFAASGKARDNRPQSPL